MKEQTTETSAESRPVWEGLEAFARQGVQELLQRVLEEEVAAMLGRRRYARREGVDAAAGYRNGYGKPRRLSLSVGTITLRRPRVRGLAERFESQLLPLFKRRTEAVGQLLPQLYLHGLALGDFDLALRGLLGDGAPLSAASVARLKAGWQAEYELWRTRSLADLEPVILWVDGVYVKAGLEKDKAAMLVVLAGLRDGRKVILAVESGHRESTESWRTVLRDLQRRGLRGAARGRRRRPSRDLGRAARGLPDGRRAAVLEPPPPEPARQVADATPGRGEEPAHEDPLRRDARGGRAAEAGLPDLGDEERASAAVGQALDHDWARLVTFYQFPKAHWKHLRTTNPIESPFAAVRLRTTAAKRFKRVENATAVIWKTLLVAEQTFRRLDAPELLAEVAEGVTYVNGVRVKPSLATAEEKAAA